MKLSGATPEKRTTCGLKIPFILRYTSNASTGKKTSGPCAYPRSYRAVGIFEGDSVTWFWIGNHDNYERFFWR